MAPRSIETDVATLSEMLQGNADFLLLDVRETAEYEIAKIEGSQLVPMSELVDRLSELEPHRDRHIVVQCHHGVRSMQVTQYLLSQGFTNVQNLAGGIDAWSLEIDASVPRY